MTVYFANTGHMDLDVVRLMGVNVKTKDNAIGHFGTGLKYAIATLMRTGHEVKLETGNETYEFTSRQKIIRDKTFDVVFMNGEQLGFTTDLGKEWQVWQAYRELHSNCLDEAGTVSMKPMSADTVLSVKGPEFEECYHERWKIFLHGEPMIVREGIEIYDGPSAYIYYRGVRVHNLPKMSAFTYNITAPMKLTEDRTAVSAYDIQYRIETRLPTLTEKKHLAKVFSGKGDWFETGLDFTSCGAPSEEFLDYMESIIDDMTASNAAKSLLRAQRKIVIVPVQIKLSEVEQNTINEACSLLEKLNVKVKPEDFQYHETLGPNIMGACDLGVMKIARQCLANGIDFTAITMYEEWIHKTLGYPDQSRGLQQYLFDKILQLIKEI